MVFGIGYWVLGIGYWVLGIGVEKMMLKKNIIYTDDRNLYFNFTLVQLVLEMKMLKVFNLKIVFSILIFIFVTAIYSEAQTPQYYNYNSTLLGNSFPFNVAAGKRIQMLYRAGDFNQPSPAVSGNIKSVSFMIGNISLGPACEYGFICAASRTGNVLSPEIEHLRL